MSGLLGFHDRRPEQAVPKIELRSSQALKDHLASHHNGFGGADWTHSELREAHLEFHNTQGYITSQPHTHGRQANP